MPLYGWLQSSTGTLQGDTHHATSETFPERYADALFFIILGIVICMVGHYGDDAR